MTVETSPKPFTERLRELFPERFHRKTILLCDYQWFVLITLVFLGFVADMLVRFALHHLSAAWFRFIKTAEEHQAERQLWKPVGLLARALVWYGGTLVVDVAGAI